MLSIGELFVLFLQLFSKPEYHFKMKSLKDSQN